MDSIAFVVGGQSQCSTGKPQNASCPASPSAHFYQFRVERSRFTAPKAENDSDAAHSQLLGVLDELR